MSNGDAEPEQAEAEATTGDAAEYSKASLEFITKRFVAYGSGRGSGKKRQIYTRHCSNRNRHSSLITLLIPR